MAHRITKDEAHTRLLVAVRRGDLPSAQKAIDAGANVNAESTEGITLLHWAIDCSSLDMIRLLIDNGADVAARSASGATSHHYAIQRGNDAITDLIKQATKQQQGHTARVTDERKDKGPPKIGG